MTRFITILLTITLAAPAFATPATRDRPPVSCGGAMPTRCFV